MQKNNLTVTENSINSFFCVKCANLNPLYKKTKKQKQESSVAAKKGPVLKHYKDHNDTANHCFT